MPCKIVYQGGNAEIVEKKSRFLASVQPVHSEEEALEFLQEVRREHWGAKHHCYAYVIGEGQRLQRFSDDGEPAGTAGKPILEVLLDEDVHNTHCCDALFWRNPAWDGRSCAGLYESGGGRPAGQPHCGETMGMPSEAAHGLCGSGQGTVSFGKKPHSGYRK